MVYFAIFFTVFNALFLVVHYFLYRRLIVIFSVSKWTASLFFVVFSIFAVGTMLVRFFLRGKSPAILIEFVGLWLGVVTISFVVLFAEYFLEKFFGGVKTYFRYGSLILIVFMIVFSIINSKIVPELKTIKLSIDDKFSMLKGFKLVQLSDLHLDKSKSEEWLEAVVEKLNSTDPDLVLITGDLIDEDICNVGRYCEILKTIKSKNGVFAVFGNHDYYAGASDFFKVAEQSNIKVLVNQSVVINDHLLLIGLDEETAARFGKAGPDLKEAIKNNKDDKGNKLKILMVHQPNGFENAVKSGVFLQLSGHTHGGQIFPFTFFVHLLFKYDRGLNQLNNSYIYTSQGTGFWGPPMRLFSKQEITEFVFYTNSMQR